MLAKVKHAATFFVILSAALSSAADSRVEVEQEQARQANYRKYAAGISALTSRLESFIAEEFVKKKGASEFPPARRYAMRDLDGDNKDDLFLTTTIEPLTGGNYHESRLLAVLTSRPNEVQHILIGGRGWRDADRFHDSGQALLLHFKVWASTDSQCCPSLASTEQVYIEKGRVLLKPFDAIKRKAPDGEK